MPVIPSQTLLIGQQFRERLDPILRAEFDQIMAAIQQQVGGVGVVRQMDLAEVIMTTSAAAGMWTRFADPMYNQILYSLIGRDLLWMSFYIGQSSVSGTPSQLRLTLPRGLRVQANAYGEVPGQLIVGGVNGNTRQLFCGNSVFGAFIPDTVIAFAREDSATWANSTNGTYIRSQIIIPVERAQK